VRNLEILEAIVNELIGDSRVNAIVGDRVYMVSDFQVMLRAKPTIQVMPDTVSRADEYTWQHVFRIVTHLADPTKVLEGRQLKKILQLRESIMSCLKHSTLNNLLTEKVQFLSASVQSVAAEDVKLQLDTMTIACFEPYKDNDDDVVFTKEQEFYIGTPSYGTGNYTDVTDWSLLSKRVEMQFNYDDFPRYEGGPGGNLPLLKQPFTRPGHTVAAKVSKGTLEVLEMFRCIEDDQGQVRHYITHQESREIPTVAGLYLVRLSDGTYWKSYFPVMQPLPEEDSGISPDSPILLINFLSLVDENQIDGWQYGYSVIEASSTPKP